MFTSAPLHLVLSFLVTPRRGYNLSRTRPFKERLHFIFFFIFLVVELFSLPLLGTVFALVLLSRPVAIFYSVLLGVLVSVVLTFRHLKASVGDTHHRKLINYLLLLKGLFLLLLLSPLGHSTGNLWADKYTCQYVMVIATLMTLVYANLRPSTGYFKFLSYVVYLMMALSIILSYLIYLDIEFDGHVLWGILYLWVMARVQELNWLNRLRTFFKNTGRGTVYILLFVLFNLVGSLFFLNMYQEFTSEASMASKDLFLSICTHYWFNYCFFYAGTLLTYLFIAVLSGAELITNNQRNWALVLLCAVFFIYGTYLDWHFQTLLWDLLTSPPSDPRLFFFYSN